MATVTSLPVRARPLTLPIRPQPLTLPIRIAPRKYFDFFALPRELRNIIYTEVYDEHFENNRMCKLRTPFADARLISEQFEAEYTDQITDRHFCLTIHDEFDVRSYEKDLNDDDDDKDGIFSYRASRSRHLDFVLMLDCCTHRTPGHKLETCLAKQSLGRHMRWVADLIAEMPYLKSISFRLALPPGAFFCFEGVASCMGPLRVIARGGRIDVVMPKVRSKEGGLPLTMWEYGGERYDVQLLAEWKANGGKLKVYGGFWEAMRALGRSAGLQKKLDKVNEVTEAMHDCYIE